jgi:hypothetical protein
MCEFRIREVEADHIWVTGFLESYMFEAKISRVAPEPDAEQSRISQFCIWIGGQGTDDKKCIADYDGDWKTKPDATYKANIDRLFDVLAVMPPIETLITEITLNVQFKP